MLAAYSGPVWLRPTAPFGGLRAQGDVEELLGWAWQEADPLVRKHRSNIGVVNKKQGMACTCILPLTIYPSPPRATAAAGAATLGAAAAAINRGGSTTVTAAATVARTRVAVMIDILCDTQAENGAVTW